MFFFSIHSIHLLYLATDRAVLLELFLALASTVPNKTNLFGDKLEFVTGFYSSLREETVCALLTVCLPNTLQRVRPPASLQCVNVTPISEMWFAATAFAAKQRHVSVSG